MRPVPVNCVEWAIPGAALGLVGGSLLARVTLNLAGEDPNAPRQQVRDGWILGGTMLAGMSAGPILTCGLFGKEPYPIPKATFILGGMSVGAIAGGAPWFLVGGAGQKGGKNTSPDALAKGEGAAQLGAIFGIVGAFVGGAGGYFLHEALFHRAPPKATSARIAPLTAPGSAGVMVSGSF